MARLRLDPDLAAVHLNDPLGNGQSQAGAALLAGDGVADKVDQYLRQATSIAAARWQLGGHLHLKRELLVGRQRLQRAADGLGNVLNAVIGQFQD